MPVPSTRARSVVAEPNQGTSHGDLKKNSFLSNVFGKLHTPGKKKTPAREDRGGHGGLGTVRKLLPFSPSRIPKSSSKADKYSAVKNTTTSPPKDCTGGRPRKRLGGLVPSPVRLFSVSDQEELIPAARGDQETSLNLKEDSTSIKVVVRVRPKGEREQSRVVSVGNQGTSRLPDTITLQPSMGERHAFTFDMVMNEEKTQLDVYQASGRSVLENCLNGYHGCLFAYGQTGSGKTYSMMGSTEFSSPVHHDLSRGIIQRSFDDLFSIMEAKKDKLIQDGGDLEYCVSCSFIEIYNEAISDLTHPDGGTLAIRDDPSTGVYVEGANWYKVACLEDVENVLRLGMSNRRVAETLANDRSSRSHSVFTATIEQKIHTPGHHVATQLRSRLHLVDLAGSERQKASGASGERLKEASNINKSLSALGHVIMSLVDVQQGKQRHIPYRDSKLTYLLQDALGGSSKTVLLATVSPTASNAFETLSTLRFADNVKRIKNKSAINVDTDGDTESLIKEVMRLREELSRAKRDDDGKSEGDGGPGAKKALIAALKREERACQDATNLREELEALKELVDAKESDLQRTKMMLRLKESRITRAAGRAEVDDTVTLLNSEIALLKQKIESHPEVKRFALENIRLRRKMEHLGLEPDDNGSVPMVSAEEFGQLRAEMLLMTSRAEQALEEVEALRAESEATKKAFHTAEKQRNASSRTIPSEYDMKQVGELEAELENLKMFANQQTAKVAEYDRLCSHAAELESSIETLANDLALARGEREDWYDAYGLILQELTDTWNEEAKLRQIISGLETSLQTEIRKRQESNEKAKTKISDAMESAALLQEELAATQTQLADIERSFEHTTSTNRRLAEKISISDGKISQLNRENQQLRESLEEITEKLAAGEDACKSHCGKIQDLEGQLLLVQNDLSDKNRDYAAKEKEISSINAALASAEMDAQMVQAQLKEKTRQLSQLDEAESELRATIISLQEEIAYSTHQAENEIANLSEELNLAKHEVQDLERELKASKQQCLLLSEQAHVCGATCGAQLENAFKRERIALQSRIKDLEEKLEDSERRNSNSAPSAGPLGKEAHARNISQKLQDAENTILFLQQETANLKNNIKSRDETLAKLRNQMAMEVNDAAQQVQELLVAQARADALETELSQLRKQIHRGPDLSADKDTL